MQTGGRFLHQGQMGQLSVSLSFKNKPLAPAVREMSVKPDRKGC